MALKDIRQFIEALDKNRELVRIKKEVDWDLELAAISRHASESRAPAPLFENIRDYPREYRILGIPIDNMKRLAISLGLNPDISVQEYQAEYEKRISRPVKPVVVKDAPCKENILLGNDVDLFKFPVPMLHESDGGRFIGTWHIVINKDPDSSWTNWGMYRVMVYNRRNVGILLHHGNHGGFIYNTRYLLRGKPMPVAIAIGVDPVCTLVGCTAFPVGVSEVDLAGALREEPVELVKCETSDLLVPAKSELVLEGEIYRYPLIKEGPFAEFTGYRTAMEERPVCKIRAISYRSQPILTMDNPTIELSGGGVFRSLALAINIKKHLLEHGVPVTGVHLPMPAAHLMVVIGVKRNHNSTVATQIRNILNSNNSPYSMLVIVDEDVDVTDFNEVLHALATKCHPGRGINISSNEYVSALAPYLNPEEHRNRRGSKVLFDCTWPVELSRPTEVPPRAFFEDVYPDALKRKVLSDWKSYGFS